MNLKPQATYCLTEREAHKDYGEPVTREAAATKTRHS